METQPFDAFPLKNIWFKFTIKVFEPMPYKDKEKRLAAQRRHYQNNKTVYKKRARRHNAIAIRRNRELVLRYLLLHPCVDCDEHDPLVLSFDHVNGEKHNDVSTMIRNGVSQEKLQEEILKCEVRCHNCHARKTAKQQGWFKLLTELTRLGEVGISRPS